MSDSVNLNFAEGGFYVSWTEKGKDAEGKKTFFYKKKVFTSQEDLATWVKDFKFGSDSYTYDID